MFGTAWRSRTKLPVVHTKMQDNNDAEQDIEVTIPDDSQEEEEQALSRSSSSFSKQFTEEQLHALTMSNAANFPDPTNGWVLERFFNGMKYGFVGMKNVFAKGYVGFALVQSCYLVPLVLLYLAASIGTAYGITALITSRFTQPPPVFFFVTFCTTISIFFLIVYGMLILKPLLMTILENDARKLSFLVELQMNGQKITARDFCCGAAGDGPPCFTWPWFKELIFSIIDGLFRKFLLSIVHSIKEHLGFLILHLATSLCALIPVVGPFLYVFLFLGLIAVQISFIYFDMVLQRKKYTFLQTLCTIWNQLSLLAGMGVSFMIMAPLLFLFLFPAAIIACTTVYVHLVAHKHTGKFEPWFVIFMAYGIGVSTGNVGFASIDSLKQAQIAVEQEQSKLLIKTGQDETTAQP